MKYRYDGPGPQEDGEGGIVRPGDERDELPDWGPWTPVDEPGDGTAPPPPAPLPSLAPVKPDAGTEPGDM